MNKNVHKVVFEILGVLVLSSSPVKYQIYQVINIEKDRLYT